MLFNGNRFDDFQRVRALRRSASKDEVPAIVEREPVPRWECSDDTMPKPIRHIFVCNNVRLPENPKGCCAAKGSEALYAKLKEQVHKAFPHKEVKVTRAKCLGPCAHGVNMVIYPDNVWYCHVTEADLAEIIQHHLVEGKPVERLLLEDRFIP